jgi:hypothetical protein
MSTAVVRHMLALPMFTTTALVSRCPLCSRSQAAIVAFAPNQVHQVRSERWVESPLTWIAHSGGR